MSPEWLLWRSEKDTVEAEAIKSCIHVIQKIAYH